MKKKSIIMIVAKYPATYGHTTVINNLCTGLNKIGYETAIGAFSFESDPPNNIKKIKLSRVKLLTKGVDYLGFDIVHTHQSRVNYYLLTKKSDIPIIFHYHAASNRIQELNLKLMMGLYKKRIMKSICVSQKARRHLEELTGVSNNVVIYNGVDTSFYNTNLPRPYKKGSPQLLFVSVLRKYKNTKMLVDAIPELIKKFPQVHLQIVGAGEDFNSINEIVKDKKLEEYVELTGKINDDELRLRYSSCDLFVSASKHEHCPVPPFEAMGCGKPLVLSNLESHNEILEASKAGLMFTDVTDLCNKIEVIYQDSKSFGDNALKHAQKYDWMNICKQVADVYEQCS